MGMLGRRRKNEMMKEVGYHVVDVVFHRLPIGFIEERRITIRTRSRFRFEGKDSIADFFIIGRLNKTVILEFGDLRGEKIEECISHHRIPGGRDGDQMGGKKCLQSLPRPRSKSYLPP